MRHVLALAQPRAKEIKKHNYMIIILIIILIVIIIITIRVSAYRNNAVLKLRTGFHQIETTW